MTLLLSGRRLLTPRQPFSPLCVSGLSSDRYLRVPPTGIPRPDEEDAPTGSGCPLWRAIGAVGLALAIMASHGPAIASFDAGMNWQFGPNAGIRTSFGSVYTAADSPEGKAEPVIGSRQPMPEQLPVQMPVQMPVPVPGQDWRKRPAQASQDTAQESVLEGVQAEDIASLNSAGTDSAAGVDPAGADNATTPGQRKVREDVALTLDEKRTVAAREPTVLPDRIRRAVLLDPRVAEMSARACQMAHRLGLARAEGRPKVTATISGSRQIVGRIKPNPPRSIFSGPETPKDREIRLRGAHTREFDHRERNNIYDGKISLRHTIIDWGERSSRAEARSLGWQAAQIDARVVMRERSHDLLQLSLTLRRIDEVIAALKVNFDQVTVEVEAVRARVEAGAGRLSDLREAQLVLLDQEIAINRARAERDIILEHLETGFGLTAEDGWTLVQAFLARRHPDLAILPADRTDKAHAIRLRARGVTHEADEIRASRHPKFDAVIDGTIFDMTDYEDEYELVSRIEMSVPLYDGGTARARLRETAWRENELKSSLDALVRTHDRETEGLAQRFNQMTREESEALARRDELAAQLRSLRERQGKTVSSPLAVARLLAQIGAAEVRLAEIRFDRELLRARALLVAEQIDSVLGLLMEDSVC